MGSKENIRVAPKRKSQDTSSSRHRWLQWSEDHASLSFIVISALWVLALYHAAFQAPFVYDDLDQVVNNPNLQSWGAFVHRFLLRPVDFTTHFLGYGGTTYRPLFWLSLYIDHALWGFNASGFHATNILLHLLNGNLLFALLRRLKVSVLPAACVSLIWLALPVNTEVVAWVSARSYLLCVLFVLVALLAVWSYIDRGGVTAVLLCFVISACALLSQELGIVLLPLLLLLVVVTKQPRSRRLFVAIGAAGLAEAGVVALRFSLGVQTFTGFNSIRVTGLALWQYVSFTLFPLHMSVERSTTLSLSQPHRWLLVELLGVALVFAYAIVSRRKSPALFGGLLWFALCIAPFCLMKNYQGVAERFAYFASIGMVAALVAACFAMRDARLRQGLMMCVAVWCVWNLYRTSVRVADWSDPVRLYQHSLEATPLSPSVHDNLAFSLRERGDLHEAVKEYQRTLAIDNQFPHAYAGLGDAYLKLNAFPEAQAAYQQALAQDPKDVAVLLNSGAAYQGAGASSDAEAVYKRILQLAPNNSSAHVNLGVLYLSMQRENDAAHQFAMAIDLKTSDPVPYYDLAVLLQKAGRGDLALVLYKKVLELKPNDEDTLRNIQILQKPGS